MDLDKASALSTNRDDKLLIATSASLLEPLKHPPAYVVGLFDASTDSYTMRIKSLASARDACYLARNTKLRARPMETADQLAERLLGLYGPYVPLTGVWRLLSFPSLNSARRAFAQGHGPVPGHTFPRRRGWFVRVGDLAQWYARGIERSAQNLSNAETFESTMPSKSEELFP